MKLAEEIGGVAEVLNKKAGRKSSVNEDLRVQLGNGLADVIHYAVAIAALNGLDMNEVIIEIVEVPQFGIGKTYNDYGQGFYCIKSIELAKEWACHPA